MMNRYQNAIFNAAIKFVRAVELPESADCKLEDSYLNLKATVKMWERAKDRKDATTQRS